MTVYAKSPWIQAFPKARVPAYPKHRGADAADVVIIGGGLTGCATAYAFAAAGVRVALLEAGRIGLASSGRAAGWIADDPGIPFIDLERAVGMRSARRAWVAWRRAALDFTALIRRLGIK